MKRNVPMLMLVAMLCAVFAIAIVGCAEQQEDPQITPDIMDPDPTGGVIEELPDAATEVYTDEEEEPGTEELPPPTEEQIEQEPPIGDDDQAGDM